jgi:Protein of unknown function (DUF2939)
VRSWRPIIGVLLAIAVSYGAYPYVTLYRLGHAIRSGDATALQALVDWPAVREGLKEDICDRAIDEPEAKAPKQLPPFGAGFVRGIAANAIDTRVTPQALASAAQQTEPALPSGEPVHVAWAFFSAPTEFTVDLRAKGRPVPIRLQMELRDGEWRVTRVWLPPLLLAQANEGT